LRIGAPPVPIASARSLERQILPDADKLIEDILNSLY
jgi:2-oxoisovalerate dehydrogenase E1 component